MTHAVDPSDDQLRACCAADAWLSRMSLARPFPSAKAALDLSDEIVLGLDDSALDQALAAHARIGERRLGSTTEDRWSRSEQAGALAVDTDVQERLADGQPPLRGALRARLPDPGGRPVRRGDAGRARANGSATTTTPSATSYAGSSPRSSGSGC